MEFKTEISLVSYFRENFISNLGIKENSKILAEVNLGFGIADLVISELNETIRSTNREPLNLVDIGVYKMIEREKKVSLKAVCEITKCNKRLINDSLDKLVKASYIQQFDAYYSFSNRYELSFRKSIAIEAKLKNWKRALMQAYRYKWFADYSYVILDYAHIKPAIENISLFKQYNIGLVSLSTEGGFVKHYVPHKEKPIDIKMQILLSEAMLYD
jgi:hypothetical protein